MNIVKCEERYKSGKITKKKYKDTIYELHTCLFEYSKYIQNSYINSIEIKQEYLVLKLNDGINLIYPMPDKSSAAFDILSFKSYEKDEINIIINLLDSNMVIFDIGANIGWHSINIAKYSKTARIYAFEPINKIFDLLKNNISLNKLNNIEVLNIGLSDRSEEQFFYFDRYATAFTSLRNNLANENSVKILAKVERMDDFIVNNNIKNLDFIKCDVEGAELLVFKGGAESIKQYLPMVIVEMVRKWTASFNYHPNEIIKFFTAIGYQCFRLENGKLIYFPFMDEETLDSNFLFLHEIKHKEKIKKFI